jgi:predicted metal-dependent HD superfamily phosphohydrolase
MAAAAVRPGWRRCHAKWLELCASVGVASEEVQAKWWDRLRRQYGEDPVRRYHTLEHIDDLLGQFQECSWTHPEGMMLCLFFHDVVYDPTRGDNEEQSCAVLEEFLDEVRPHEEVAVASTVGVLCTKYHSVAVPASPAEGVSSVTGRVSTAQLGLLEVGTVADIAQFLDLDMSILASDPERYGLYARQIREEYAHIPQDEFVRGRAAFLRSASGRTTYLTPQFEHLNARARRNMERELQLLTSAAEHPE